VKRVTLVLLALALAATTASAQQIYLTATSSNELLVANRNGTGAPTVLFTNAASSSSGPAGLIAVLGNVNKLFYGGGNRTEIDVANVDGSGVPAVLWSDAGDEHLGITGDPATGMLFWTTESGEAIRSGAWDGSGVITDVFSGMTDAGAVGITFDSATDTLYWTSVEDDAIYSGASDGSTGPTQVYGSADGVIGPRQIVFSNGMLYWTEHDGGSSGTGRIVSAPANGSGTPSVLHTVPDPFLPYGIDIDGATLLWTEFEYQSSTNDRVMTGAADGSGSPSVLFAGSFGGLRGIAAGANILFDQPPPEMAIPTLSRWGAGLLMVLLAGGAIVILRRMTSS